MKHYRFTKENLAKSIMIGSDLHKILDEHYSSMKLNFISMFPIVTDKGEPLIFTIYKKDDTVKHGQHDIKDILTLYKKYKDIL